MVLLQPKLQMNSNELQVFFLAFPLSYHELPELKFSYFLLNNFELKFVFHLNLLFDSAWANNFTPLLDFQLTYEAETDLIILRCPYTT